MANKNREKSPGLALLLSFVPGLGAIYNGELMKGVSYMGIFTFFVYLLDSPGLPEIEQVFLGIAFTAFYIYTIIETYNRAKVLSGKEIGEKQIKTEKSEEKEYADPWIAGTILLFGILFLLINLNLVRWDSVRVYWPIILIILGGKLTFNYFRGGEK